jgi:dienelactone hydrolase
MLIWGGADDAVPPSQSIAFREALEQARFRVRTLVVPGAGHFWFSDEPINDPTSYNHVVAPRVLRFLNDSLNKQKS